MAADIREMMGSFEHGPEQIRIEHYKPTARGRHPAVLLLHGREGLAWAGGTYRLLARGLAAQGLAVFLVHYFGGPRPLQDVRNKAQFLGWVGRLSAALGYAAARPTTDPHRTGVLGFSLGGYLALALAARDPRLRAVVELSGGLPDLALPDLRKLPPVLVVHGTADPVVPFAEAERLVRLLEEAGVTHEQVFYPGEGHTLGPVAARHAAGRAMAFLNRHLQAPAADTAPAAEGPGQHP